MRISRIAIASLALLPSVSVQAAPASIQQSEAGWLLDYADDRCRIIKTFESNGEKNLIYFEQAEPSDRLSWVIGGTALDDADLRDKVRIKFGPEGRDDEFSYVGAKFPSYGNAVNGIGVFDQSVLAADETSFPLGDLVSEGRVLVPERVTNVEWVDITVSDATQRLVLGEMGPVYDAMNTCMDNLLTHWGLDPAVERSRQTAPVDTNRKRTAERIQEKYPYSAVRKGKSARIAARVLVDANGSPTDCKIVELSQSEEFGAGVCRIIKETSRFKPATDASGKAIPSYDFVRIVYQIQ